MKKFVSTMRKGFHISFENGLTVSVQWGAGNYCDNHFPNDMDFSYNKDAKSDTAEVAVIETSTGKFLNANDFVPTELSDELMEGDVVIGWLTPEQLVDFLMSVKNTNVDGDKQ